MKSFLNEISKAQNRYIDGLVANVASKTSTYTFSTKSCRINVCRTIAYLPLLRPPIINKQISRSTIAYRLAYSEAIEPFTLVQCHIVSQIYSSGRTLATVEHFHFFPHHISCEYFEIELRISAGLRCTVYSLFVLRTAGLLIDDQTNSTVQYRGVHNN